MNSESWDGFREYTVAQLIEELRKRDPREVVSVEVHDSRGNVVEKELVQIKIGTDNDVDGTGVYRWTNIVVRKEPCANEPGA